MAISVTEILGTDSLSGSRLVLNDNFNVLASEINAMEVYFSPSAGTITGLTSLTTEALRVGISTVLLDINSSTFDISANVTMNASNLTLTGGGIFRNDTSPDAQNFALSGAALTLGTTLGKHCIVGAHAVLSGLYPDYCVIVGAPGRIVKRYDTNTKVWKKTKANSDFIS